MSRPEIISREQAKEIMSKEKMQGRFFCGTCIMEPKIQWRKRVDSFLEENFGFPFTVKTGKYGVKVHCVDPNNPQTATTAHIEKYERVWNSDIRARAEQKMDDYFTILLDIIQTVEVFPFDNPEQFESRAKELNLWGQWKVANKKLIIWSKEKGYRNFNTDTARVLKTATKTYWIANTPIFTPEG